MVAKFPFTEKVTTGDIWKILSEIPDPEIPVLSITDLGIVRDVKETEEGWDVFITPTYSGCPAMDMISTQIRLALISNNVGPFQITTVLSPAWTTEWMTETGKRKLSEYGIAPPNPSSSGLDSPRVCPHCNSSHTHLLSQFGSTACKALYQCDDCKEPFDYFKCH